MRHAAAFAAFVVAMSLAAAARADDAGDVRALMDRWSATYASATSGSEMLVLYDPAAVFWGTGAREPFVGAAQFEPYFATQFRNFTDRHVTFVDPVITLYGDRTATAIGLYRFNVTTRAGEPVEALLRFSFAFVKEADGGWKIIHQHSSQLPN